MSRAVTGVGMAALKNQKLISKLSLGQKLQLICSGDFYNTSAVEGMELPTLKIKNHPFDEGCENMRLTRFPNAIALAGAWNTSLVEDVFRVVGEEARAENGFVYFNCTNNIFTNAITSEYFVLSEFVKAKIKGLNGAGQLVNFQDVYTDAEGEAEERRLMRDSLFAAARPDSAIVSDMNVADSLRERHGYNGLIYCPVATVEEALDALYGGSSLLFLERDISGELYETLGELTKAFTVAHTRFMNDGISESAFARLLRNFKIFDPSVIDRACDSVLSVMFSMLETKKTKNVSFASLTEGKTAGFDEISHHALAVEAARQSAVLVKNEGGILPFNATVPVAVIGEYADDITRSDGYYTFGATAEKKPYDLISKYPVNAVGFARGYAAGESGRRDLTDAALSLCARAECALVYLSAPEGEPELPAEQVELLKAISARGVKIVAVVASSFNIDLSFAKLCDAVLLTYVSGQGGAEAALEILSGAVTPSGKLTEPVGMTEAGEFKRLHRVGFGLSYTQFEYRNLQINERGVTFTVINTGNFDGCVVPQLYVKKEGGNRFFAENRLRGFTKIFIKRGDAVSVDIPFGKLTFSLYGGEDGYFVEGGEYTVSIFDGPDDIRLSGTVTLERTTEARVFGNEVIASSERGDEVEFTIDSLSEGRGGKMRSLSPTLKIFLAVILAVYVDAVLCVFLFSSIIVNKTWVLYASLIGIAVVANALAVYFTVLFLSQRRKAGVVGGGSVLVADMLEGVEEFTEIAKVRYRAPVAPAEEDYEEDEEEYGDEAPEEQAVRDGFEGESGEETFFEESEEEPENIENVSTAAICLNLKEFAASRGIVLEIASARSLIAAMAASKIVFITSRNASLLPAFEQTLNEYFSAYSGVTTASDSWNSRFDLFWRDDGDELNLSDFTAAVYSAANEERKHTIVIIDNVDTGNLASYFSTFISYANRPAERWEANLGENVAFTLPDNITYVLVPVGGNTEAVPPEILSGATVVDVTITSDESQTANAGWVRPVTFTENLLKNMAERSRESFFLSDGVWNKLDALSDNIAREEKFNIDNKNMLQIERYTSVLLDAGADEREAVTAMFLGKLNFLLKNTKTYKAVGGDRKISALIENIFAEEELTKVTNALIKAVRE